MQLLELENLLRRLPDEGGAELILCASRAPFTRVARELRALPGHAVLDDAGLRQALEQLVGAERWQPPPSTGSLSFAAGLPSGRRVRGLCSEGSTGISCTLRLLPASPPALATLALPPAALKLTAADPGLVLIAGPLGSGKSTILSALVGAIDAEQTRHIVSVEDPIEHVHDHCRSVISQRQVAEHCSSCAAGIAAALQLDPDVIVIDGLDSPEAQQAALRAATAGVLVLASLRATGTARALEQLLAAFAPAERASACNDLADSLQAVLSQELLPRRGGGLVPIHELLLRTPNLASVLRDGKTGMIAAILEAGRGSGMQTLDMALLELAKQNAISGREAYARATDKKAFQQWAMA